MSPRVPVQIIDAPTACADGVKDSWREVPDWAAGHLKTRFAKTVQVKYYDLFDADCPAPPSGAQLPLVLVDGVVISSGSKVSLPLLRKHIEALGVATVS